MKRGLRLVLALAGALAASSASARAETDAVTALKRLYAAYQKAESSTSLGPDQLDPRLYSKRRRAEIAALRRACSGKDFCLPDFDHLVDGQASKITALTVTLVEGSERAARVEVRFRNFETPTRFVFTMVKETNGWKIDDLKGGGGEADYTLDDVLKPNP